MQLKVLKALEEILEDHAADKNPPKYVETIKRILNRKNISSIKEVKN